MRGTYIQGVIIKPGTGKDALIEEQPSKLFDIVLKKDVIWYMGIDQSTSCTGIALKAADRSFLVLLDVIRDKAMPKEDYFRDLRRMLLHITHNITFDIVVNEKPVPKKMYAHDVLVEFLGRLNTWIDDIPELSQAQHGQVFPQTWKSLVMDKSKGKNRMNIKAEVASDLVDKYPELNYYYNFCHTPDYDAFDALGILDGYIAYAFTPDGYPQIHGVMEKSHVSVVLYDWINWDSSISFNDNIVAAIGDNIGVFEPFILYPNQRYTWFENVRMASSNFGCVATIVPDNELRTFQWKYGINPNEDGRKMLAIIMKRGNYTAAFLSSAREVYKWNEEIFAE